METMNKQDSKFADERERQRSALQRRMEQQKEKKQEQQVGQIFEILDSAMVTEQS